MDRRADKRLWWFLGIGLLVALLVAGVLSGFASGDPDGLERVSIDQGLDQAADSPPAGSPLVDSPLADYTVEGVESGRLSTALAGIIGVAITLTLSAGLFYGIRLHGRARRGKEAA